MLRTIGKLSLGVGVASYGSAVFYRPLPAPETQQQQVQPPTTASASASIQQGSGKYLFGHQGWIAAKAAYWLTKKIKQNI